MSTEFQIQVREWIVKPKGEHLSSEKLISVRRDDEGAGQFLIIAQQDDIMRPGEIRIDPEEWAILSKAVGMAMDAILADELHDFAPKDGKA